MKKLDVECLDCGAGYRRIELVSRRGTPGTFQCVVCHHLLETFNGKYEVAYLLTVTPERPATRRKTKLSR
jgi:hypothetical protein